MVAGLVVAAIVVSAIVVVLPSDEPEQVGHAAPDGERLFAEGTANSTACGACHTLADAESESATGPNLDEVLSGQDGNAIRQSIVEPDARISEGFQPGIMPANYASTLSQPEIDALVEYLSSVRLASGVSTTPREESVGRQEVQEQVAAALDSETGSAPGGVRCPRPLEARIGVMLQCLLVAENGDEFDVDLEVTAVGGDRVRFDIEVADAPREP